MTSTGVCVGGGGGGRGGGGGGGGGEGKGVAVLKSHSHQGFITSQQEVVQAGGTKQSFCASHGSRWQMVKRDRSAGWEGGG